MDKIKKNIILLMFFACSLFALFENTAKDNTKEMQRRKINKKKQIGINKKRIQKYKQYGRRGRTRFSIKIKRPRGYSSALKKAPEIIKIEAEETSLKGENNLEKIITEGQSFLKTITFEETADNNLALGANYLKLETNNDKIPDIQKIVVNKHLSHLVELAILRSLIAWESVNRGTYQKENQTTEAKNEAHAERNTKKAQEGLSKSKDHQFLQSLDEKTINIIILAAMKIYLEDIVNKEKEKAKTDSKKSWSIKNIKSQVTNMFTADPKKRIVSAVKNALERCNPIIKAMISEKEVNPEALFKATIEICMYYIGKEVKHAYPYKSSDDSQFLSTLIANASLKQENKDIDPKAGTVLKIWKLYSDCFFNHINKLSIQFEETTGVYATMKKMLKYWKVAGFVIAAGAIGYSLGKDVRSAYKNLKENAGDANWGLGDAVKMGVRHNAGRYADNARSLTQGVKNIPGRITGALSSRPSKAPRKAWEATTRGAETDASDASDKWKAPGSTAWGTPIEQNEVKKEQQRRMRAEELDQDDNNPWGSEEDRKEQQRRMRAEELDQDDNNPWGSEEDRDELARIQEQREQWDRLSSDSDLEI